MTKRDPVLAKQASKLAIESIGSQRITTLMFDKARTLAKVKDANCKFVFTFIKHRITHKFLGLDVTRKQ